MWRDHGDIHLRIHLRIPWDRFVARGFLLSVSLHLLFLLFMLHVHWSPEPLPQSLPQAIPVEFLTLGWGTSEKPAGGNLTLEGSPYRARNRNALEDARVDRRSSPRSRLASSLETIPAIPTPATEVPVKAMNTPDSLDLERNQAQGTWTGSSQGSGLGKQGGGSGKGSGFSIEWGGGGNRAVIYKVLPQYPRGYNVAGKIRLRFIVLPDGSVSNIIPIQRSDPVLERAAIEALRQWRFNPLPTPTEMVGIITFTFQLQ